ncbi:MAG: DUF2950 family protein, partial [Chloroflexi bacterium]|nr:DUF2950 family protein [Chloroflexota bacterium]
VLRLVNSRLAQPADFEDWLLHAGNAAVLEAQGFRWRFTHDRLRKALVDAIPEDERRQLNRLLAGAVEAIYGAQSSEHAAALARHWEAAGEPVRAADYLRRAAAASLATSAYREAITIVERALALLADHPATPQDLLAGLIGMRARASINVSDYEAAQRDYQRLHDVGAMTDNAQLTAEAVRGLGRVAEGKGEYPTALERYRDALERFRTLADKAGQAAALQAIGGVLYRQNAYDEALQHLNESLSYYDETGSKLGTADVLRSMGSVLHATGQPEQGIQHWRRASIIYRKLGNRHGLATCLNNIGLAAEMRGDHEEAKGYYEQALALKREIGNLRSIGVSLNNLGVVAINLEQYDEASRLLQEAIDIAHAIGDQQGVADAFNNLGLVELYRGSYQDAERSLLQSRAICEAIGDRWGIALTHLNLGKVRRDQGHPDDARAEFAQAVAVAQAINLTAVLLQVTVEMATLLTGSDDDRAQAVALLTFAVNHERIPGAERDRAASLLDDLKRVLPAEAYQQGREHAAGLTLESVVERLRR